MALELNKLHDQLDSYMKTFLGREEYKDVQVSTIYKNGVFKVKTKSVTSLTVLRYLLKILVPNKMTRVLWPLYDNRMEAEFRRIALEILSDIFKNNSRVQKMNMSILMTGYGLKFVHTLLNIASEIIQRDLNSQSVDMALRVTQLEKKCVSVKVGEDAGVKVMLEAVERAAGLRQADQLVLAQRFVEEAQTQASKLILDINHVDTLITKIEGEATNYVKEKNLDAAILHEAKQIQEFHSQVKEQSGHLNELMDKVYSLLGKAPQCEQMAVSSVQQISGGESSVNLLSVVREAHAFRNSNPMVTIFGTAESGDSACISLIQQFMNLVSDTDKKVTKDIATSEADVSARQAQYQALTEELKREMNWAPSIPEPRLVICDTEWLNTWDAHIRGEPPVSAEENTGDPFQEFKKSVKNFLDISRKKDATQVEQNGGKKSKLTLAEILFSDVEESPPSSCTQNSMSQQNAVMSPTNSGSPLACSSRLMSSLASTPVRKHSRLLDKDTSPEPLATPAKKHEDSLLRNLLYSKMSEQPPSPSAKRPSFPDGFNNSFGSSFKLPSNLSQTTASDSPSFFDASSPRGLNGTSVLTSPSPVSVFDALLDESSPSPSSLRDTPSPVAIPPPESRKKPRPSLMATIEKFRRIKERQSQDVLSQIPQPISPFI